MGSAREFEVAANSRIFHGLNQPEIEEVLKRATRTYVRPYTQVCNEGEPATAFFLILDGEVKYCRSLKDGRDVLIRMLSKDDCFGLGSFVRKGLLYLGTAETTTFCDILRWSQADIRRLSHQYPQLQENAIAAVLGYLGEYSHRHAALVSETATMRLARALIDLAQSVGRPSPAGVEIKVSNDNLGALADVGRFTTSRTVAEWNKKKLIHKKRNSIQLIAPEALIAESA
jgi:CRP-like cAMP-binding protein